MEDSDEELVAQVARGDAAAFTRLIARHRKRLTAMIARIVGPSNAEDIAQETFTRAWTQAPAWKAPAWSLPRLTGAARPSYAAWLSRVAVNMARDQARRRPSVHIESVPEPPDPASDAETMMIREERDARLRAAIVALPERQRVALSLAYDAELSNADAAAAMTISVGAYELLLVRGRRALRTAMRDEAIP